MTEEDEPELAWDHPGNVEHNDVVAGFENRLANEQFPFDAPLLVVTAQRRGSRASTTRRSGWTGARRVSQIGAAVAGTRSMSTRPSAAADAVLSMAE